MGGGFDQEDGVSRFDEVAVAVSDQKPELLLLGLDLALRGRFEAADLQYGFGSEERFGVADR